MLISQDVPPLGASNKGVVEKTGYFRTKCVNIAKTVRDTFIITINEFLMTIESYNLHMRSRLTPRSMTLEAFMTLNCYK